MNKEQERPVWPGEGSVRDKVASFRLGSKKKSEDGGTPRGAFHPRAGCPSFPRPSCTSTGTDLASHGDPCGCWWQGCSRLGCEWPALLALTQPHGQRSEAVSLPVSCAPWSTSPSPSPSLHWHLGISLPVGVSQTVLATSDAEGRGLHEDFKRSPKL